MDKIGWIGSLLLALCAVPQAIESYKTKSSAGLTWGFISMWFVGEICTFIYIIPKMDFPLLVNYGANICFLTVIIYYKINPKKPL